MRTRFVKHFGQVAFLLVCLCLMAIPFQHAAQANAEKKTVMIPLKQGIERGLESFLERALASAKEKGADLVVLDIDTPGGEIGAAGNIARLIREAPMKTVAFIDNQAFSAGTYISLNADQIVMTPGSSMGAATPVYQNGNAAEAKVISAWSEMMAGAAKLNNRNPEIARAMVEIDKEIPGIKRSGTVLSLDATKALEVGYADKIVKDKQELFRYLGVQEADVEEIQPTLSEQVARIVTSPTVMSLLFVIGLVGLTAELFIPGIGVSGTIGLLAFALFFFGHYVAGFASWLHIGLFLLGGLLLILEIILPGGIVGTIGFISLVSGIILAAYDTAQGALSLGIAAIVTAIVAYLLAKYFGFKGVWSQFILKAEQRNEEGYVAHTDKRSLLNQAGTALTPLRPAGIVKIGGQRIDAVSAGGFISAGSAIIVIQVEGTRVVVQELDTEIK